MCIRNLCLGDLLFAGQANLDVSTVILLRALSLLVRPSFRCLPRSPSISLYYIHVELNIRTNFSLKPQDLDPE